MNLTPLENFYFLKSLYLFRLMIGGVDLAICKDIYYGQYFPLK